jgi:hypothetical protein
VQLSKCSLCLLVLCLSVHGANASTIAAKSSAGLRCGIDPEKSSPRIFANSDRKQGWHEYQNVTDVPALELGMGQFARLWAGTQGMALVRLEEPGDDFTAYTDYCFEQDGQLIALEFTLRTAWGWGYREEGPVTRGELAPQLSEFFDTTDEAPIKRPEQADNIPDALKPHMYTRKSRLPFANLWPR